MGLAGSLGSLLVMFWQVQNKQVAMASEAANGMAAPPCQGESYCKLCTCVQEMVSFGCPWLISSTNNSFLCLFNGKGGFNPTVVMWGRFGRHCLSDTDPLALFVALLTPNGVLPAVTCPSASAAGPWWL